MSTEETSKFDFGSIDFTPDWAKKDAGVTVGKTRPEREERPYDGDRKPFRKNDEPRKSGGFDRGPRQGGGRQFDRGPRQGGRGSFDRKPRFEEKPKPLDVEVKILPESKALGTIIRKLQSDSHAFKLKDLAYFFLDNPQAVLLKITNKPGAKEPVVFHQCKACGFASTRQEDVVEHLLAAHLGDYYEAKEIEVEPPKGNFTCVAKCGITGVLIGPPNEHSFNSTIKEMIRTRCPEMSEAEYRSRLVMVREAEAIEEWRKGATKKTVYVSKTPAADGAEPIKLTREQAEAEFRRAMMPQLLDQPKNLMITADKAMISPVKPLVWAAKDALEFERRAPYNMCFALRGAFHHRKMNFFRANDSRGPEFVVGHELKEFDAAHAIPELAKIANFIAENPCEPSKVIIGDDAEAAKHLDWLVSTGHVVAFTNGVYSPVEKFPKYGPQFQKKLKAVAAAPEGDNKPTTTSEAAAPVQEAPVQEAPVQEEKIEKEEVKNETADQLA